MTTLSLAIHSTLNLTLTHGINSTQQNVKMPSVAFSYCYAECHYAGCRCADYNNAECHYTECHKAERHYAECGYTECRYAECHYA